MKSARKISAITLLVLAALVILAAMTIVLLYGEAMAGEKTQLVTKPVPTVLVDEADEASEIQKRTVFLTSILDVLERRIQLLKNKQVDAKQAGASRYILDGLIDEYMRLVLNRSEGQDEFVNLEEEALTYINASMSALEQKRFGDAQKFWDIAREALDKELPLLESPP